MSEATMLTGQAAPPKARIGAQTRIELLLTLRRGTSLLLTFVIPVFLLAFFTKVDILGIHGGLVDYLYPGIVALAVLSTAMVSLAIATGFERSTGVLKRLAVTPLRRSELLTAKVLSIIAIEVVQVVVLTLEALLLGWRPESAAVLPLVVGILIGTVAFAGLGLLIAGTLPAMSVLALANGLYLLLLLFGGIIVPVDHFPSGLQTLVNALPATALSDICRGALDGTGIPVRAWVVLIVWAVVSPAVAARVFRWE